MPSAITQSNILHSQVIKTEIKQRKIEACDLLSPKHYFYFGFECFDILYIHFYIKGGKNLRIELPFTPEGTMKCVKISVMCPQCIGD